MRVPVISLLLVLLLALVAVASPAYESDFAEMTLIANQQAQDGIRQQFLVCFRFVS